MIRRSGVSHAVGDVKRSIRIQPLSIEQFVSMIQPGFAFSRISDGGFFCLQGRRGVNCDGAAYSPEQAKALLDMIKDSQITHGITSIALHVARATEWLLEHHIDIQWYDADVMNKASDDGELFPFVRFLQTERSLIVGPAHLDKLKGFPITTHVICHATRAFEEVDALASEIEFRVDRDLPSTILLSAGQGASPTLVSWLHKIYPKLIIIDCGSLWDPYVRVFSRSGHKKRGWSEYKRLGMRNFKMNIEDW